MHTLVRFLVFALVSLVWTASAANVALKVVDKEPPKELRDSVRAVLQPKSFQVLEGEKPLLEIWLVKEVALQTKPASPAQAMEAVKPASLLLAATFGSTRNDYREDQIAPGTYTGRFALQPQDGNHLGTSEFAYFIVLVPAKSDTSPDGIKDYKQLVTASSKETSTDHPMVLSLRPVSGAEGDLPKLTEPAPEHKSVRVKIPVTGQPTPLIFDIVYEGKGHK